MSTAINYSNRFNPDIQYELNFSPRCAWVSKVTYRRIDKNLSLLGYDTIGNFMHTIPIYETSKFTRMDIGTGVKLYTKKMTYFGEGLSFSLLWYYRFVTAEYPEEFNEIEAKMAAEFGIRYTKIFKSHFSLGIELLNEIYANKGIDPFHGGYNYLWTYNMAVAIRIGYLFNIQSIEKKRRRKK